MQGSLEEPPVIFRARRWSGRRTLSLLIILPGMANLAFQARDGSSGLGPWLWAVLAVVGLSLVTLAWTAISPPTIEVSPSGVRRRAAWRTKQWAWTEIGDFRVARYTTMDVIGFNYENIAKRNATYSQMLSKACGSQGLLMTNMADPLEEIVGVLNRGRAKWLGAPAVALPVTRGEGIAARGLGLAMVILAGRVSRRFYWSLLVGAAVLGGVVSVLTRDWSTPPGWILIAVLFAARGRLRDIGRSQWWLMLTLLCAIAATFMGVKLGLSIYVAMCVGGVLLAAALLALGLAPGRPGPASHASEPDQEAKENASAFS